MTYKFKNVWSEFQIFHFDGINYTANNGYFETEDVKLAEFLRQNVNFVEEVQETKKK